MPGLVVNVDTQRGYRSATIATGNGPVGVVDGVDGLDPVDHGRELSRVGQLELEAHLGDSVVPGQRIAGDDVHVVVRQGVGHVAQQVAAVECDHLDAGPDRLMGRLDIPFDVDHSPALVVDEGQRIGAVGAMHADAATAGHESDDRVAGQRRAAVGESDQEIVETLDVDTGRPVAPEAVPNQVVGTLGAALLTAELAGDSLRDPSGGLVTLADGDEECVEVRQAGVGDYGGQLGGVPHVAHRQSLTA